MLRPGAVVEGLVMLNRLWPLSRKSKTACARLLAFAVALWLTTGAASFSQPANPAPPPPVHPDITDPNVRVTPVPEAIYVKYNLDREFYKKHIDYKGFSILSSAHVSDLGLLEAYYLIDKLLGEREDILKAMIKRGARFMVMSPTEMTTDVPEQRSWDKAYWDARARGMGGRLSSCGEENLLNLPRDRYSRENILIHEFNHAIHQQGLGGRDGADPTFVPRLNAAYRKAMDKQMWKGMYSATNAAEYWSEGVQAYFDTMRPQYVHNTREKLKAYDEDLYNLVNEVYGKKETKVLFDRFADDRRLKLTEETITPMPWRYVRFDKRHPDVKRPEPGKDKDKDK
jgi:alpha-glucosidase